MLLIITQSGTCAKPLSTVSFHAPQMEPSASLEDFHGVADSLMLAAL